MPNYSGNCLTLFSSLFNFEKYDSYVLLEEFEEQKRREKIGSEWISVAVFGHSGGEKKVGIRRTKFFVCAATQRIR